MNCDQVRRRLAAYEDEELSDGERDLVMRHIAECESCRAELFALRRALQAAGAWDVAGADLWERVATAAGVPAEPGKAATVDDPIGQLAFLVGQLQAEVQALRAEVQALRQERQIAQSRGQAGTEVLRREEAEIRNRASQLIYQASRLGEDARGMVPQSLIDRANVAVTALTEAVNRRDTESARAGLYELNDALLELSKVYFQRRSANEPIIEHMMHPLWTLADLPERQYPSLADLPSPFGMTASSQRSLRKEKDPWSYSRS